MLLCISAYVRTDDFTICCFREGAGGMGISSSLSWWSLSFPLELEMLMPVTQAENQGHTGLSTQF